ncbi:MAG: dienelactone hydrolase [Flavobacterium sp.]|jgi:hypothetical protein
MAWTGNDGKRGTTIERDFTLHVDGHEVPGVYWEPSGGADRLVMVGHGGTTHKKAAYILLIVDLLIEKGIAAIAIDGPGHGDRMTKEVGKGFDDFADVWNEGGGTAFALTDWKAALDFIEAEKGARPTGWWGLSMGTMMGLPVCANEPRISVALLGLMGTTGVNSEDLITHAPKLSCPVRFLVQWDDEIVPRDSALALFDMLGSKRKTLVANPGMHQAVPIPEFEGSVSYLDRYLGR